MLGGVRILQACQLDRASEITAEEVSTLCSLQNEQGSWGQHIFGTIVILLALARLQQVPDGMWTYSYATLRREAPATPASTLAKTLTRGLLFVLRHVRDDGSVPFIPDEDTWLTCMGGVAMFESGANPECLDASIDYIRSQQRANGGWAYAEGVEQTDMDDSSMALLLLSMHGQSKHQDAICRVIRHLEDLQNEDGGFPTFLHGAESDAEITAKTIRALGSLGNGSQNVTVSKAWNWLIANQARDGSFRNEWNACTTFPVLHIMGAIASCQLPNQYYDDIMRLKQRCIRFVSIGSPTLHSPQVHS